MALAAGRMAGAIVVEVPDGVVSAAHAFQRAVTFAENASGVIHHGDPQGASIIQFQR